MVEAAKSVADMAEALRPIVDERGSPGSGIVRQGTPVLQPTDERRRTGSHYTPRSLTQPIVQHALEPAFERIGARRDAGGSAGTEGLRPGHGVWRVPGRGVPAIGDPTDRRMGAISSAASTDPGGRRTRICWRDDWWRSAACMAWTVTRWPSIWRGCRYRLATLARDHEFTFLDHALKSGDSLVGLTARQIGGLRWKDEQSDVAPFDGFLRDRIAAGHRRPACDPGGAG